MAVRNTISEKWQGLLYDLMAGKRLSDHDADWIHTWLEHQEAVADDHDDREHMAWAQGWIAFLITRLDVWIAEDKAEMESA